MARRVWLLVEWVDDNNVFPSYGVINIDTFSYKENDLETGKQIFISLKNNEPQRASIIRISDNKRQVKEHMDFLERQDQKIKNVMELCMRTIKEMKSDQYSSSMSVDNNLGNLGNSLLNVITARTENSASDSDTELHQNDNHNKITKYIYNQSHHKTGRLENTYRKKGTQSPATNQRRRSIISSTPLPGTSVEKNIKLCFDQGTQTDNAWFQPPIAKIEEIELVLMHLHGRFESLVMNVNKATNGTIEISEFEQTGEVSYVDQNGSWVAPNNVAETVGVCYNVEDKNAIMVDISTEQIVEAENQSVEINMPVKIETGHKISNESSRVRRMSAQTTYSNEMVPIGNGHAMVPTRFLNEIDWTSYTTATRQLLQAVFPRKVLATHSLTGKPSPAHLNKPAKKLLNPNLVDDIIMTVSAKSRVPKNLVRNTITIKCTDEAKLYRNRLRYRNSCIEKNNQNDENLPPSLHSSDESSHLLLT